MGKEIYPSAPAGLLVPSPVRYLKLSEYQFPGSEGDIEKYRLSICELYKRMEAEKSCYGV